MQKLFNNSAVGHFLTLLSLNLLVAVAAFIVNDPSFSDALVSIGVPLSVAKFLIDLLRPNIPNL